MCHDRLKESVLHKVRREFVAGAEQQDGEGVGVGRIHRRLQCLQRRDLRGKFLHPSFFEVNAKRIGMWRRFL